MTSRDGYNRNRPMRGNEQSPQNPQRQESNWKLDADELDRYMSGQPSREPRFDMYGRSQSSGRTERVPAQGRQPQSQPLQPQYDDYTDEPEQQWQEDEYDYEDEYDEYQQEPVAPQPSSRSSRPASRSRQPEPEYEDDLYDDPYVLDDEEHPRRQPRRNQRPTRERSARPSAGFALPPMIADAPIVKDRMALTIAGVGLLSLLAMVIVVLTQRDGLNGIMFTHVNANGEPENLQDASAIWNLPLVAGMVTLISAVAAWFLARWGAFLPRFLLGGALGVQFVVWVAVIAYLF